jgi:hypothetical protein
MFLINYALAECKSETENEEVSVQLTKSDLVC